MAETETSQFEALLENLKQNRGFDFTGYKRSTLLRRVEKRMQAVAITAFGQYSDYLEVHPDEFRELFNTILINVTGFLRDPEAWEVLRHSVVEPLSRRDEKTVRVWSAGCASGEETYTLMMLFSEVFGIERFKQRVKVYATDADNEALNQARHAVYTAEDMEALPRDWVEKYFEQNTNGFAFRNDLRRCVIFGEHDLVQDAPISRLDLLVCRNTLIYFNADTQSRILARFHFALKDSGFLFLGKSEMLLTHARLFQPVETRARIFSKVSNVNLRDRLLVLAQAGNEDATGILGQHIHLRESGFDAAPVAQLIVDRTGVLVMANEQARNLFHLNAGDIGKRFQDLEISYRPIELRSRIEEAYASRTPVRSPDIESHTQRGEVRHFDVQITPLLSNGTEAIGASISFVDVTTHHSLRSELERSTHELEAANEELQSTIEELETTNEELQSTNEELETMNEELQSTNEELETINEELRHRTNDLNAVNEFMETIMSSIRAGVVVTDPDMNITLWNSRAEDLWGLRQQEVEGKGFLTLEMGLPVAELARPMQACLDGQDDFGDMVLAATNRRGRKIQCRVTCSRLANLDNETRGLILFMEEWNSKNR